MAGDGFLAPRGALAVLVLALVDRVHHHVADAPRPPSGLHCLHAGAGAGPRRCRRHAQRVELLRDPYARPAVGKPLVDAAHQVGCRQVAPEGLLVRYEAGVGLLSLDAKAEGSNPARVAALAGGPVHAADRPPEERAPFLSPDGDEDRVHEVVRVALDDRVDGDALRFELTADDEWVDVVPAKAV